MMQVAFINSTKKWGGVKTWSIDTALGLREFGATSILFGRDTRFMERAALHGLEAHRIHFGPDYNPILIWKFYKFFKIRKITHVIVNVGKDLKSAGIAAKMLGIPVIIHIGSPGDILPTLEYKILHKLLQPSIVCCSEYTKQGFLHNAPHTATLRVAAIHPGVGISAHPLSVQTKPTFITTSQLDENRRHVDLIDACAILAQKNLDFQLNIVGEGTYSTTVRERVAQLGLENRVHFLGYVNDVGQELKKADFFVLPSRCEGLGIALEEAMAHGLIPMARNIGGAPEIWPDFLREHLIHPDSRGPEFADLLGRLAALPQAEVLALKNKVRDHARETFSITSQAHKIFAFLSTLPQRSQL